MMNKHTNKLKMLNAIYTHADSEVSTSNKSTVNAICNRKKNAVTTILLVKILNSFFIVV